MAAFQPAGENVVAPDAAVTGWRVPDRERDRLVALHRVSTLVAKQRRTDDVLREALQCAVSLVGGDAGAIHRWLPEREVLSCVVAEGATSRSSVPSCSRRWPDWPGVRRADLDHRERLRTVEDGDAWSREAGLQDGRRRPDLARRTCIGILSVGSYDASRTFDADDVELLELFAVMVAVALVTPSKRRA